MNPIDAMIDEDVHAVVSALRRPETEFKLVISSTSQKGRWGKYQRIGLLEVLKGYTPSRIDIRNNSVIRVVQTWEKLHTGTTERDMFTRYLRHAESVCAELNQGQYE